MLFLYCDNVNEQYIIDRYGGGRMIPPPNTPERLRYTYWYHPPTFSADSQASLL
jgi:hypothetical protein